MSKLIEHWIKADVDLDWVMIERELTSPFKPKEALAKTIENEKNKLHGPIPGHSKMVWQEVHKNVNSLSALASTWHNPKWSVSIGLSG